MKVKNYNIEESDEHKEKVKKELERIKQVQKDTIKNIMQKRAKDNLENNLKENLEELKTMHETYYSNHICCSKCGLCITCKDCKCIVKRVILGNKK